MERTNVNQLARKPVGKAPNPKYALLRRMTGFPFHRKGSLVLKLQEILLHIFFDNLHEPVLNIVCDSLQCVPALVETRI